MLDRIPWRIRLEFWIQRNSEALKALAFPLVALALVGAYWPLRTMMIDQEARVSVVASTLTVAYIICLYIIGSGSWKLIKRFLGHRRILKWAAFGGVIGVLFLYLELVGYEVKW